DALPILHLVWAYPSNPILEDRTRCSHEGQRTWSDQRSRPFRNSTSTRCLTSRVFSCVANGRTPVRAQFSEYCHLECGIPAGPHSDCKFRLLTAETGSCKRDGLQAGTAFGCTSSSRSGFRCGGTNGSDESQRVG